MDNNDEDIYYAIQGGSNFIEAQSSRLQYGLTIVHSSQNIPTSSDEKKYRIHLGTQPEFYTSQHIIFEESRRLHLVIIDAFEKFLNSSNANYEFIRKDAFSTGEWGLEPYACISFNCSKEMAKGLAAIIGLALRQDAIGIYNDIGLEHPVFTVTSSDQSSITDIDALFIMEIVSNYYKDLSAQFDEHGQALELHDFDSKYDMKTTIEELKRTINVYFKKDSFQVTGSLAASSLLEEKDYDEAIKQAELVQSSDLIKLTRLHLKLYNKPKSIQQSYIQRHREPRYPSI